MDKQTIALEYRYANDNYERLPVLAAQLVRLDVTIIVANGTPASLAAKQATSTIPVVMFETADPVGSNLVSNLARPGGNITGVAQLVDTDLFGKQLEMLKEIVPKLSRVGLLFNPANPVQWTVLRSTQVAAHEFEREVATATRNRIGALIVTRDNIFVGHIGRLVDLAAQHRLPTMYGSRAFANAGGLIAYGPSPADSARRAAGPEDSLIARIMDEGSGPGMTYGRGR